MAINQYDIPDEITPIQSYVSQYVPLPVEEVKQVLNARQLAADTNRKPLYEATTLVSQLNGNDLDEPFVQEISKNYSTMFKDLVKSSVDPSSSSFKISVNEAISKFANDPNIRILKRNIATREAELKTIKEAEEKGELTPMHILLTKEAEEKYIKEATESFKNNGTIIDYKPNNVTKAKEYMSVLEKAINNIATNSSLTQGLGLVNFEGGRIISDPNGGFIAKKGNNTIYLTENQIKKVAGKLASTIVADPNYLDRIRNYFGNTDLESAKKWENFVFDPYSTDLEQQQMNKQALQLAANDLFNVGYKQKTIKVANTSDVTALPKWMSGSGGGGGVGIEEELLANPRTVEQGGVVNNVYANKLTTIPESTFIDKDGKVYTEQEVMRLWVNYVGSRPGIKSENLYEFKKRNFIENSPVNKNNIEKQAKELGYQSSDDFVNAYNDLVEKTGERFPINYIAHNNKRQVEYTSNEALIPFTGKRVVIRSSDQNKVSDGEYNQFDDILKNKNFEISNTTEVGISTGIANSGNIGVGSKVYKVQVKDKSKKNSSPFSMTVIVEPNEISREIFSPIKDNIEPQIYGLKEGKVTARIPIFKINNGQVVQEGQIPVIYDGKLVKNNQTNKLEHEYKIILPASSFPEKLPNTLATLKDDKYIVNSLEDLTKIILSVNEKALGENYGGNDGKATVDNLPK